MKYRVGLFFIQLCAVAMVSVPAGAATIATVHDPTTNWTTVPIISLDPSGDQQTGQGDADLVGIVADPGFYTAFDGTNIYYRARLGKASQGTTYSGLFWIGIDGNGDGALDLFIGVNNQGSTAQVGFYAAGTGLNTSPNTTSIASGLAQYQTNETTTNFDYEAVSATIDPTITNTDLNADAKPDVFLSLMVPFFGASGTATLQGALAGLENINITQNSKLSYVIATSTQVNSLNQDIGGTSGNTNSSVTYAQLGAISPPVTGTAVVVPEPGTNTYLGIAVGLLSLGAARRRKIDGDSV